MAASVAAVGEKMPMAEGVAKPPDQKEWDRAGLRSVDEVHIGELEMRHEAEKWRMVDMTA